MWINFAIYLTISLYSIEIKIPLNGTTMWYKYIYLLFAGNQYETQLYGIHHLLDYYEMKQNR